MHQTDSKRSSRDKPAFGIVNIKICTWVNGERLAPRSSRVLQNGDEIVFGRNGVKVIFKRG